MTVMVEIPARALIVLVKERRLQILQRACAYPGMNMSFHLLVGEKLPRMYKLVQKLQYLQLIQLRRVGREVLVFPTSEGLKLAAYYDQFLRKQQYAAADESSSE